MTSKAAPRTAATASGRQLLIEIHRLLNWSEHAEHDCYWSQSILAIEAEAAAGTALDVDLMREIVQNGVPPDALMVTDQPTMQIGMGGKGLYDWWHLRWAPTLAKVRARLAGVEK